MVMFGYILLLLQAEAKPSSNQNVDNMGSHQLMNVTRINECVGVNNISIRVYEDMNDKNWYIADTNNFKNLNKTMVMDCFDEQQLLFNNFLVLIDDWEPGSENLREGPSSVGTLSWDVGKQYFPMQQMSSGYTGLDSNISPSEDNSIYIVQSPPKYTVFSKSSCNYEDACNSWVIRTYHPSGCMTTTNHGTYWRAAYLENNYTADMKWFLYPHHTCSTNAYVRNVPGQSQSSCIARNIYSLKATVMDGTQFYEAAGTISDVVDQHYALSTC